MKSIATLVLVLLSTFLPKIAAQDISCNNFCVTNIRIDSTPGFMIVSIFFSADEEVFINYPYVSLVTNANGDTLATGTLNFFGQFGNTEYEYHLNTSLDSLPENFTALLEFKYDTNTCILDYPCPINLTNEWFPVGAEWYYSQSMLVPPYNGYVQFQVIDTIVINNKMFKEINGGCEYSEMSGPLYQDGDKIFAHVSDSLTLLYDFTLVAGDTLGIYMGSETSHFIIDSISTYQAGPLTLRVQHIHSLKGNHHEWGTKIYERVGSSGCLFPTNGVCDPATGGLRCYEDDITGLLNFTFPELPCDFISAVENPIEESVKVYPNPATDGIHVASEDQMHKIELIHLTTGNVVLHQAPSQNASHLDITDIPPGTFLLKILFDNGSAVNKKVVIAGRRE